MSLSSYQVWYQEECNLVKEEYPAKCHALFARIVLDSGNIDGDDLYSNFCSGNRYRLPGATCKWDALKPHR